MRVLVTRRSNSRGKSKGYLATLLERKNRFYLTFNIPDRTAKAMFSAIEQLCRIFPNKKRIKMIPERQIKKRSLERLHTPPVGLEPTTS